MNVIFSFHGQSFSSWDNREWNDIDCFGDRHAFGHQQAFYCNLQAASYEASGLKVDPCYVSK